MPDTVSVGETNMESGKNPSPAAAEEFQVIQKIMLPHIEGKEPGPLHTVVTDPEGNLYYSDEMNHSVVALCNDGALRWHKTKRGNAPGEFWYPRGLSLGFIQSKGETIRCLAVADACNRRVQFLDLEGTSLSVWTHAKEIPFGEIADVRFIEENVDDESDEVVAGFWYVLDRGNHRLCRLNLDGSFLDQTGRGFPQNLEKRWAVTEVFFSKSAKDLKSLADASPFDFSFYPDRILGSTIDSLFVSEANSLRLKQVIPPHLLPICIDNSDSFKWVAADGTGLLAWDRSHSRLMRHGSRGDEWEAVKIVGEPISSDQASDKYWLQSEDSVGMWEWPIADMQQKCEQPERYPWILQSAVKEMNQFDRSAFQNSVEAGLAYMDEEIKLTDYILLMGENDVSQGFVDGMLGHAPIFPIECEKILQRIQETMHCWCLSQLERYLAGPSGTISPEIPMDLEQMQKSLAEQICVRMASLQKRIDGLSCRLQLIIPNDDASNPNPWKTVALISHKNLEFARQWITGWSGITIS